MVGFLLVTTNQITVISTEGRNLLCFGQGTQQISPFGRNDNMWIAVMYYLTRTCSIPQIPKYPRHNPQPLTRDRAEHVLVGRVL